jgi:hypothetical protein
MPLAMKRLWPALILLFEACAKPAFSFRGYTELSNCRNVIDAEISAGASFFDAFDTDLDRGEGVVTRLHSTLFATPVGIFVTCYRSGEVGAIDYIFEVTDPEASAALFIDSARELDAMFGEPQQKETAESRARVYHCGDPATVELREAIHGDMEFEVSLTIVPRATGC